MRRIEGRGEERESFENMDDLERTRSKMLSLQDGWFVVDNTLPLEEVEAIIGDHVSDLVSKGLRS
jgi:thymidylate kinase